MKDRNPPKLAELFFKWFCHQRHLEGLEGDLYELFESRISSVGIRKARLYFLIDMATLLRSSVAKPFYKNSKINNMGILNNYVKTALRMGWKRKGFSLINIFGLTMGITSIIFISLYVADEMSFDNHLSDLNNKYRIYNVRHGQDGETNYLPIVPPVFGPSLKENFPQVKRVGRVLFDYGGTVFNIEEKPFAEKNGVYAEPEVFDILNIKLVAGDLSRMKEPKSVILSKSLFEKFFGHVPYNEQTVSLTKSTLLVAGIFEDIPKQSHLELDYVFPLEWAIQGVTEDRMQSWVWQQFYTYIQFHPETNIEDFSINFRDFVTEKTRSISEDYGFYYTPFFQPLKDIHLNSSHFEWDIAKRGSLESILFLTIAATIILLIACLNFINLTTAQAFKRAKEVSVRKFIGANRKQLLLQYCLESSIYTFIAGIFSIIIFILLIPSFNDFTGKFFDLGSILNLKYLVVFLGSLLLLGLISGLYPAIVLTSFKPLTVLHGIGNITKGQNKWWKIDPRQLMVATQYILSIGLIIISLIIQQQYNYLQKKDMGFNKENLIVIPLTNALKKDFEATRQVFSEHNNITNVSFSYGIPGGIVAGDGVYLPQKQEMEFSSNMFMVDHNYLSTMKMKIIAGRDFSLKHITDESSAFIINETAVYNIGYEKPEDAIGESVKWSVWGTDDSVKTGKIIGVVEDFNFISLHNKISSTVLHLGSQYFQNLIVRVGIGDLNETVQFLEDQYRSFEPTRPFEPNFLDQTFAKFYESENKLSKLFTLFTVLAILTATIGLFGLVSFNIVSRSKEISIRKVLGASTGSIFNLLVKRYFVMMILCLLIAIPVAIIFANNWLENFAYRVDPSIWTFFNVSLATISLTFLTVTYQAIMGSRTNPADKLRNE